jgi:acetyltransferase
MTQIDYDREMTFIAVRKGEDGYDELLGVVSSVADPDNQDAEFAIIIRSDLKGRGLGHRLMSKLLAYCRQRGTRQIVGESLSDNQGLLHLVRGFGFKTHFEPTLNTVKLCLSLQN